MKQKLLNWYSRNFMDQFYEVTLPDTFNMASLALDRWADRDDGDKLIAIYHENEAFSFARLQSMVNRMGNVLKLQGLGFGDRALVRMGNHPMYLAINLAIIKIGAVAVPTSTLFKERELEFILNNCEAKMAIVAPDLLPELEAVKNRTSDLKKILTLNGVREGFESIDNLMDHESDNLDAYTTTKDDGAFVLYTSGTTGFPKGVPHKHAWMISVGDPNVKFVLQMSRGDRMFTPIEMTWMWPWGYCFWWTLYAGGACCIYPGRFDPEKVWIYLEKYGATHLLGNPTIYRRLLRVPDEKMRHPSSSLKMAFSSGETVEPGLFNEWKRRVGTELYDCLGQTESHVFVCTRKSVLKPGSLGKPLSGCPVAVVREDGSLCDPDETGYLALEKDWVALTSGYIKQEEEWKSRIIGDWYLTWDFVKVDQDGFLWYISRTDDLIKSRGYLIGPKEVEDVLAEHESVLESAVIGVADPDQRERVKAFIVLKEGFVPSKDLAELTRNFTRKKIAPYKVPKEIEYIESLPKTVTGKTMRKTLKEGEVTLAEGNVTRKAQIYLF
ncbi:MAG: acyl-CoA synthetase [Thaumarchaeota archaeon]|nr:acyl-CoA synthetase [Nitrososphaerota archaeon]